MVNKYGSKGADFLSGTNDHDYLFGDLGNDYLFGNGGNDVLDGGAGSDFMAGGTGDDVYWVDSTGDTVFEYANEGTDTVFTSISYTLPANVENLWMTDAATAVTGTGNELNNILVGNSHDNSLYGQAGNDVLYGYGGNDWLDGGDGFDVMYGGTGNDVYVVGVGDIVVENPGEGTDTVISSIDYTLGANLENLLLTDSPKALFATGNDLDNILAGNSYDNTLKGGAGADTLYGYDGQDTLDGGPGADTMVGGNGYDIYYVDNVNDVIIEKPNEGVDWVYASVSYTLPDNVEGMYLVNVPGAIVGVGNSGANDLHGNSFNNILIGGAGNDTLDGDLGTDILTGGTGNDFYYVNNTGDLVIENANEGDADTVISTKFSYTLPDNVENLYLARHGAPKLAIDGTGNELDNYISGNDKFNVLSGLDGNDQLWGWGGGDKLTGGSGADVFGFWNATDSTPGSLTDITDFSSAEGDKIDLGHIDADTTTDGDQAFSFIGSAAFSNHAGQLRYAGGLLLGDINGDGTADLAVQLHVASLSGSDFIL